MHIIFSSNATSVLVNLGWLSKVSGGQVISTICVYGLERRMFIIRRRQTLMTNLTDINDKPNGLNFITLLMLLATTVVSLCHVGRLKEYYEIFFIFTLDQIIVLNTYCI